MRGGLFDPALRATPVARVGDDIVELRELTDALGELHGDSKDMGAGKRMDFRAVIDRIISARLVVAEARQMGLDDSATFKDVLAQEKQNLLRAELEQNATSDIVADADDVERLYKDRIRQWKLRSLLVREEAVAQKAADDLRLGKPFAEVAEPLVADAKAQSSDEDLCLGRDKLQPAVLEALKGVDVGAVPALTKMPEGFVVLQVRELCFADDPKARTEAERASLSRRRNEALKKYFDELVKKYAVIDEKRLARLDLEANTPGFESFLKDTRALATIEGEAPITVGDVVTEIQKKFYHSVEGGARRKKLNTRKQLVLDSLLYRRVGIKEAARLELVTTASYQAALKDHENGLLFGEFLTKVLIPDIKINDDDLKAYYDAHRSDYVQPGMVKLTTLGFTSTQAAEDAIAKLRAGTDVGWLRANAPDRAPQERRADELDSAIVGPASLDPSLAAAIAEAQSGDFRLWESPQKIVYAVWLKETFSPTEPALEDIRGQLQQKLMGERLNKALEEWTTKLRASCEVKIYLD